jgi:hypothetical protein
MLPRETSGSLNKNSDDPEKSMEKKTQNSNQSARDYIKLSSKSTPENPGLYGGMKPSDRASTSDGSRSRHEELMLGMMADMRNELKQANQENGKLQKNMQDLTNRLKQANREKEELANQLKQANRKNEELADQLKQARLGGSSSLQKVEASSQPIPSKETVEETMRKWFASKAKPWENEQGRSKQKKSERRDGKWEHGPKITLSHPELFRSLSNIFEMPKPE